MEPCVRPILSRSEQSKNLTEHDMKARFCTLLILVTSAVLWNGCVAVPPLINVQHRQDNSNLEKKLDSIERRLDTIEKKMQ